MKRFLGLGEVIKKCPPLYREINRRRKWRLHEPGLRLPHKVFGNEYCAWAVPDGYLSRGSIVYAVGVGEDISFDSALANRFGCKVFSFDPTPIAVEFMNSLKLPEEITFVPIGLTSNDGITTFFTPQTKGFNSFSKVVDQTCGESSEIESETLRLASIMKRLGHTQVDLLKMDIEGFEYEVVDEIILSHTLPNCLLIEFHHLLYGFETQQTYNTVAKLLAAGYRIFWISDLGREYGFILGDGTDPILSLLRSGV
jgi:FkbM family methyltransferase